MRKVIVSVPASTANLGPGFDCLGLALGLHNTVELQLSGAGVEMEIEGEGKDELPLDSSNLIARAAHRVLDKVERGPGPAGLKIRAINHIPLGSGLGSSAAAALAGLAAANTLTGGRLSREELLKLAYELEGHADNAAAALFGGLTMVVVGKDRVLVRQAPTAELKVAVALPGIRLSTPQMREALPKEVLLQDAVFNLGRIPLVVEALRTADYALLSQVMVDKLHEPYRRRFVPGFDSAAGAARRAGAAAVALSGAGPAMVAFAPSGHERIAQAMALAFEEAGLPTRVYALPVDRQGVRISEVVG